MNTAPIFTTGTTLTSTGTAVTDLIPLDSAGATPRYIRVTATASGYFRTGRDTTAAVAGDMMVQPGDAVHLAVPGSGNRNNPNKPSSIFNNSYIRWNRMRYWRRISTQRPHPLNHLLASQAQ